MKTKKKHSLSWLGVDQLHQTQIYLKNVPGMSQQNDLTHFALGSPLEQPLSNRTASGCRG